MALRYEAFVDESEQNDEFVLAGHIARPSDWIAFSKDWEELLPLGTLSDKNRYHFKMSEMALNPERMSRVPVFYKVIEKYVNLSFFFHINLSSLERARQRAENFMLYSAGTVVNLNRYSNPYYFSVLHFLTAFYQMHSDHNSQIASLLQPWDSKIDFVFDQKTESSSILGAWDDIVEAASDDELESFGATPRFANDQDCLPLQGADLWAWWAARWYEEDGGNSSHPINLQQADFGFWQGKTRHGFAMSMDENEITDALQRLGVYSLARRLYND